jgi:hypothetical protein
MEVVTVQHSDGDRGLREYARHLLSGSHGVSTRQAFGGDELVALGD